jgi:hypothetical protein
LKKQKELLELEERILKRKTAIQKIENDLLEEESNKSEEDLVQFDADFPTKEKVQDLDEKEQKFERCLPHFPVLNPNKPGKLRRLMLPQK